MKYNGWQQNVEEDGRIKGHLLGRTKERVRTNKISYGSFQVHLLIRFTSTVCRIILSCLFCKYECAVPYSL